jgi:hypothetical protein
VRRRAEDEYEEAPTLRHGHADSRTDGDEGDEWPVAQLWLPNPDSRRGWELRHVYPHKDEPRRAWGFGKERR